MPARAVARTWTGRREAALFCHGSLAGLLRFFHAAAQSGKDGGIGSDTEQNEQNALIDDSGRHWGRAHAAL
ncbi:hypothetical protein NDU88_005176 [Pleurodeles waltl]|uniref:Uncharacterized protein n=1 Tax=Pleurodeles waltl TaxID=8319 RepID=A0AAV7SKX0_PLEWA|nr:hypothetical protein NDU88_005176 [Pleurodeles waltl]